MIDLDAGSFGDKCNAVGRNIARLRRTGGESTDGPGFGHAQEVNPQRGASRNALPPETIPVVALQSALSGSAKHWPGHVLTVRADRLPLG